MNQQVFSNEDIYIVSITIEVGDVVYYDSDYINRSFIVEKISKYNPSEHNSILCEKKARSNKDFEVCENDDHAVPYDTVKCIQRNGKFYSLQ